MTARDMFTANGYTPVESVTEMAAHRDVLAATLREVLGYLPAYDGSADALGLTKVVDGKPLVRTPWLGPGLVGRWRAVLDEHGGTNLIAVQPDSIDTYCKTNTKPREAIRP